MGRPQLLLVTRNLPPLRGGMERLNARMALELAQRYEVTVLAPKGSSPLGDDITLRTSPVGGLAGYLAWAAFASVLEAVRSRPTWVLGGSGLVAPVVWLAARIARARMALYVHGLDLVVDHGLYRLAWLPFIRRADRIIANSANTAQLARDVGVPHARVRVVNPGTSLPEVTLHAEQIDAFRAGRGLVNARILLSVGRLTARKGLAAFVDRILPRIVSGTPSAVLVVIGDDAQDALAGGDTSQRALAQAAASRHGLQDHVRFLGPVDEEELVAAYAASDVHVFPIREVRGDVEGFGMVAIEAAAHGLPTVATRVGGVPDAVAEGASGFLVAPDDPDAFVRVVNVVLDAGRDAYSAQARDFAAAFAWPRFGEGVRSALDDRS
jgi:phosphatidyl-myo-inositol dimannoside synthase